MRNSMKMEGLLRLFLLVVVAVAVVVSTSAFSTSTSQQGGPTRRRQRTHQHRHPYQHQHQHQLQHQLQHQHHQRQSTALAFGVDPSHLSDLVSSLLADGGEVAGIMTDPASMTDVAAAPADDNGWFGFLTIPIMGLLQVIHTGVASVAGSNSWGISIIVLTILIKVLTFPLTKTQLESTTRMQAMQPAMKQIQTKYQSNPEVMNQKMAEFYQQNNINPLAGCLPSLLQIPIFIGLYRAVLDLAKENKLNEPFLFLPSLEGPTYGADPATANDWIFKGLIDGTPALGWDDTLAFLVLPLFLVVSQYASVALMQPKTAGDDPQQQQSNAILKVLPLMIGWFALSVPSALSVYWATNNIVTTAASLWIKNSLAANPPPVVATSAGSSSDSSGASASSIFAPPREKPSGFAPSMSTTTTSVSSDGVKPITAIDAEIISDDDDDDAAAAVGGSSDKKKRRKGKKKKN